MRYFVISDIHGYYDVLLESLQKAGYTSENPNHHLLVLGDLFDRGKQSDQVLAYLYALHQSRKATILLGNHDAFLLDFLEGRYTKVAFNIMYNGFGETLMSLSQLYTLSDLDSIHRAITTRYPYLLEWLQELPYYVELDDYIFVHGGIDGGMLDWKTMMTRHDFVWSREIHLPLVPGKIVVAGHHRVATIRKSTINYELLFLHNPEYFDILYADGKILIDRFVEISQQLNVLILDV